MLTLLLVVSMIGASFSGISFGESSIPPDQARIRLEGNQIWEAAREAIEQGEEIQPESGEYAGLFDADSQEKIYELELSYNYDEGTGEPESSDLRAFLKTRGTAEEGKVLFFLYNYSEDTPIEYVLDIDGHTSQVIRVDACEKEEMETEAPELIVPGVGRDWRDWGTGGVGRCRGNRNAGRVGRFWRDRNTGGIGRFRRDGNA